MKKRDLKAKVLKQGLSVTDLAERIGIHGSSLYKKLRGEVDFQLWELKKIYKVLNLSKDQMWEIFFDD